MFIKMIFRKQLKLKWNHDSLPTAVRFNSRFKFRWTNFHKKLTFKRSFVREKTLRFYKSSLNRGFQSFNFFLFFIFGWKDWAGSKPISSFAQNANMTPHNWEKNLLIKVLITKYYYLFLIKRKMLKRYELAIWGWIGLVAIFISKNNIK